MGIYFITIVKTLTHYTKKCTSLYHEGESFKVTNRNGLTNKTRQVSRRRTQ